MRKPMMAGNWKMNNNIEQSVALVKEICALEPDTNAVDCVVCPPFVCISSVEYAAQGSDIGIGAQNMHWEESGAYTGEVSAPMLTDIAEYVIIGHSERRQYFAETNETVNKKVHSALAHGLTPIMCVGESLEQNQAGETQAFVGEQVKAGLAGLNAEQVQKTIIAYEPIWAIGTGLAATAEQAQEICGGTVRAAVRDVFGPEVAENVRVLYGGSTKPSNISEIMQQPDIDGALIGGAALKAADYCDMVRITAEVYAG
jgi:triosephosphate isomerase